MRKLYNLFNRSHESQLSAGVVATMLDEAAKRVEQKALNTAHEMYHEIWKGDADDLKAMASILQKGGTLQDLQVYVDSVPHTSSARGILFQKISAALHNGDLSAIKEL